LTGKQFDFTWAELPGESYRAQVARDPDFKHMVTEMRLEQPRWSVPKPFQAFIICAYRRSIATGVPDRSEKRAVS